MVGSTPLNAQERLPQEVQVKKQKTEWKLYKGVWISTMQVLPGVWQRKEGGHVVRARAKEQTTGRIKEIMKVLSEADASTALKWLEDERSRVRTGVACPSRPKVRFSEFASSLFESKVAMGEIRSAKGRQKWQSCLGHFIGGTKASDGSMVRGFGDYFLAELQSSHIQDWKEQIAGLVEAGEYSPTTVNTWLSILRVIAKAAKRKYQLSHDFTDGVTNLNLAEHATYTEEEPNALLPEEVAPFLTAFRESHPEHFAMVYLGLVTGLRPSSLRPLRRRGGEPDVIWDANRILVRRSHTVGGETMRTTKQKRRYSIDLPAEAMDILRWHVDTQMKTLGQQESDLLFPAVNGKFRTPCVLNKPLANVALDLNIGKSLTQRGLRRTFNDLARAAQVNDLVTRSISGHLTSEMQHHYSTVNGTEQREALARVIRLVDRRPQASTTTPTRIALPGGEVSGEEPTLGGEVPAKKA